MLRLGSSTLFNIWKHLMLLRTYEYQGLSNMRRKGKFESEDTGSCSTVIARWILGPSWTFLAINGGEEEEIDRRLINQLSDRSTRLRRKKRRQLHMGQMDIWTSGHLDFNQDETPAR
jgi:hypothetical protein